MIKVFLVVGIALLACGASAYECTGAFAELKKRTNRSLPQDQYKIFIESAKKIYIGKIISGKYDPDLEPSIRGTIEIVETIKGLTRQREVIKSRDWFMAPDIVIGNFYLVFIYGPDQLSTCAPYANLGKFESNNISLKQLKLLIEQDQDLYSERTRILINLLNDKVGT